jgi:hypothetical protein
LLRVDPERPLYHILKGGSLVPLNGSMVVFEGLRGLENKFNIEIYEKFRK